MDQMSLRRVVAAAVAALVLVACRAEGGGAPPATRSSQLPTPTPTPTATRRPPTRVDIEIHGPTRRKLARSVRDLKRVGVWQRLVTRRLYVIQIQARPREIPDDEHLADANLSAVIEEKGAGGHCFILDVPAAIRQALAEWNGAADSGYARWRPPSERHYWAAILAHELAHCQRGQPGEKFAYGWTGKAFKALGRPDLVSYARDVYEYVRRHEGER